MKRLNIKFKKYLASSLGLQLGILLAAFVLALIGGYYLTRPDYKISNRAGIIINTPDASLTNQTVYSPKDKTFTVDAKGLKRSTTSSNSLSLGQTDGGAYSATLPTNLSNGIAVYDNTNKLNFSLVPRFSAGAGKKVGGHFVYPMGRGNIQAVYTAQSDQLAEDIVINRSAGNTVSFAYQLKLPAYLQAKAMPNGGIGIYSANPLYFSNINFGSDTADQAKIETAKTKAPKTYLMFVLVQPVIKESNNKKYGALAPATARFELHGNNLSIIASGLNKLHYPISIDPSVIIASAANGFNLGNNQGNDNITNSQVGEAGLSGASITSWTDINTTGTSGYNNYPSPGSGNNFGGGSGLEALTFNGYIYVAGGVYNNNSNNVNNISYALICTSGNIGTGGCTTAGSLGSWTQETSDTFSGGSSNFGFVAYNGFIYVMGGTHTPNSSSADYFNDVQYAAILSNGSVGSWTTTSSFTTPRAEFAAVAYNGYLYLTGGLSDNASLTTFYNDTQYAPIKGNGAIGSWTPSSITLPASESVTGTSYNGYIYVAEACTVGGFGVLNVCSATNNIEYAQLLGSGGIGPWQSTSSFSASNYSNENLAATNGYIYFIGGFSASTYKNRVKYAAINANGSLGSWTNTVSLNTGRANEASVAYNGYIYVTGGNTSSTLQVGDTEYGLIAPTGYVEQGVIDAATLTTAVAQADIVASHGYLYVIGGRNQTTPEPTTYYGAIGSDGSISSLSTTTALISAVTEASAVVYNGYVYVIGGCVSWSGSSCLLTTNVVQFAPLASNGTIGTFNETLSNIGSGNNLQAMAAFAYNDWLYVLGGQIDGTHPGIATVIDAPICNGYNIANSAAGCPTTNTETSANYNQLGTFNNATYTGGGTFVLNTAVFSTAVAVYKGNVYVMGGDTTATTVSTNLVQFAQIDPSTHQFKANAITLSGSTIPTASGGADGYAANGYLYYLGGYTSSNSSTWTANNFSYYAPINSDGTIGTWAQTNIPYGGGNNGNLEDEVFTGYNGYIYEAGGDASGGPQTTVASAAIGNGGTGDTVGAAGSSSWNSASSGFNTVRGRFATAAYNGYVYILGGITSTNANDCTLSAGGSSFACNGVQFAPICTGSNTVLGCTTSSTPGMIGTWNYTSSTSISNGYPANNYSSTPSTNGGFNNARSDLSSVVFNGYLYILGGVQGNNGDYNDVQFAPICTGSNTVLGCTTSSQAGTIGTWNYTSSTSGSNGYTNNYSSSFNANDGFNEKRYSTIAAAYNGYLYIYGGFDYQNGANCGTSGSSYCKDTQYAPICTGTNTVQGCSSTSAAGTIGTWDYTKDGVNNGSTASGGILFPSAAPGFAFASGLTYNGYLYLLGGEFSNCSGVTCLNITSGVIAQDEVEYAPICTGSNTNQGCSSSSPAGSVGTWAYTTSFLGAKYFSTVQASNGYLYIADGLEETNECPYCDFPQQAPINSDGSIGNWSFSASSSNTLTLPNRAAPGSYIVNGNLYIIGGWNAGSTYYNDIQFSGLGGISHTGNYSLGIDTTGLTGIVVTPISFRVYGSNTGNPGIGDNKTEGLGGTSLSLDFTDDNCPTNASPLQYIFGPQQQFQGLVPISLTTISCGPANQARYLQLLLTLDDSQTASFPDSLSSHTAITGFNLWYHPNSQYRLNHGGTLINGVKQSLDAPPSN